VIPDSDNAADLLSCFVRGAYALDLTGVSSATNPHSFHFEILEATSAVLSPGIYQCQFVLLQAGARRKTLSVIQVEVCPSFEFMGGLDTRSKEEKELEEIEKAIASLSNGVAEYYVGTRRVRYVDLSVLYERQNYLRNRMARRKNPKLIGGRNVGVKFD
jgi:hypothetical protein